jgi:hypothetical protein
MVSTDSELEIHGVFTALFPGKIELLMLKFADRFEALAIIDGFLQEIRIPRPSRRSPIGYPDFSMSLHHITCQLLPPSSPSDPIGLSFNSAAINISFGEEHILCCYVLFLRNRSLPFQYMVQNAWAVFWGPITF